MPTNFFDELFIPDMIADPRPTLVLSINNIFKLAKSEFLTNSLVLSVELSFTIIIS